MKKKFVTNLALLLFLNLLVKPFWILGIDRSIQNIVGAESYGFYFSLLNFSFLFNIILDVGINNFNNRNIAQNSRILSKHFSNLVVLKLYLAVLYFALCMATALVVGYDWGQIKLLFLLVFNQFLLSFILYLRSNLAGLHLFRTDSIISVLDRVVLISICGILLWGNVTEQAFQIEWLVYAQTASYISTAVITLFIVASKMEFIKLKTDRNFYIAILKQSFPFALLILLQSFYYRVDSVMLERILSDGKEQAGIYAQSFRILDAVSMFAFLFASLLLPIFSKMLKQKDEVKQLTKLSFLLLIIPSIILVIVSFFYDFEIMDLFYHYHVEESSTIYAILMTGFLGIASSYIFGTLLTANGNLKALNYMAAAGMIINIIMNAILIPLFKAKGAAIASCFTQIATAMAQIIIAKQIFKFHPNIKLLFSTVILIAILFISGYIIKSSIENWIIGLIFIPIIGIILTFVFRILRIRSIYEILKYGDID